MSAGAGIYRIWAPVKKRSIFTGRGDASIFEILRPEGFAFGAHVFVCERGEVSVLCRRKKFHEKLFQSFLGYARTGNPV